MKLNATREGHLHYVNADVSHLVLSPEREGHGDERACVSFNVVTRKLRCAGCEKGRVSKGGRRRATKVTTGEDDQNRHI